MWPSSPSPACSCTVWCGTGPLAATHYFVSCCLQKRASPRLIRAQTCNIAEAGVSSVQTSHLQDRSLHVGDGDGDDDGASRSLTFLYSWALSPLWPVHLSSHDCNLLAPVTLVVASVTKMTQHQVLFVTALLSVRDCPSFYS